MSVADFNNNSNGEYNNITPAVTATTTVTVTVAASKFIALQNLKGSGAQGVKCKTNGKRAYAHTYGE